MIRFLLRMMGSVLLAGSLAVLLSDAARSVTASRLVLTTVVQNLAWLGSLSGGHLAGDVHPHVFASLLQPIASAALGVPTCVPLAAAGLLCLLLGRTPAPSVGVLSR